MTVAKNPNGVDLDVTWDAASCPASDYNLLYGDLAAVATYAYSDSACALGITGAATFTPPAGDIFFVVVAQDGSLEGTHGFDSEGKPRPASSGGDCGASFQIRSDRCP
jgi:hypothetical protein